MKRIHNISRNTYKSKGKDFWQDWMTFGGVTCLEAFGKGHDGKPMPEWYKGIPLDIAYRDGVSARREGINK